MKIKQFNDPKYNTIAMYVIVTSVIIFALCTIFSLSGGFFKKIFNVLGLVLHPIISGGIIAYLFEPVIQKLEKLFKGNAARPIAVVITGVVILAVFIGGLVLIGVSIRRQSTSIKIDTSNFGALVNSLGLQISEVNAKVQAWLSENSGIFGRIFKVITGFFGNLSDSVSNLFFAVIFGIYYLLDSDNIGRYWSHVLDVFVKPESQNKAREIISDLDRCFSGYIRGKLADAALVFVMVSIAMLISKIPYAFVIGLMTAIGNLIPFVGPIGGIIALLVICLSEGLMSKFVVAAVVLIVLMQIDANVFNPRLMSRSISIHPLLVFSAMIAGGAIGGVTGMLVSAPIAAFLKIRFDKYMAQKAALTTGQ